MITRRKQPRPKALWVQMQNKQPKAKGRSRVRAVSARQIERNRRYAAVKKAWWPTVAGTDCPVMLEIFGKHVPVAREPHHVRGRRGALLDDTRFWLAVSRRGHAFIHDNPKAAIARGWLGGMGEWDVIPKES